MGDTREALLDNKPITRFPKLTRVVQDGVKTAPRDQRFYVNGKFSIIEYS
jgi:hypothetical protein